ncbi:glycerol-3-phosphate dehydrogenase/oxidase [Planctomicrobium sp. SH661]|uniref:glycerol-3-phosphate dehydrogenase/oxidase n=1 Tax=Planctomicrobium sp. SH661 TaxID=3448124 RepID=UPI003F5BC9EC
MNREAALARLSEETWDVVVIGGGATGLGTAVDAASRGFSTLLLEQADFAKATSSRSTKLIHGGVRYLQQGNVHLVRESLHERGLLLRNAPQLVRPVEFIIPAHSWVERIYYATGLKAYDLLAGRLGMAGSRMLSREEMQRRIPTLKREEFSGGVSYFDAQFDDARLAVSLAQTLMNQGGVALNYVRVHALLKENGRVRGVEAEDGETGDRYRISAKSIVNATGIFSDEVRRLDDAAAKPTLSLSQGAHIVVDRKFLPASSAIIVPRTDDGRVLFLIPWHGATVIGTTDTPVENASLEPRPMRDEINFLLEHSNRYLSAKVERSDIRSSFAGLRPLVRSDHQSTTSKLSRDHVVHVGESGLVSIAGGKWTTFRKMGADAVEAAIKAAGLPQQPSRTESLRFSLEDTADRFNLDHLPVINDEFIRECVRDTMARTVEDILARRSRMLFVNVQEALQHAPHVATVMAQELHFDEHWIATQLAEFQQVAEGYQTV